MRSPVERAIAAPRVAGKSHSKDFRLDGQHKSQFHRPWRRQFRRGTRSPWVSIGGWAMWIIWYVAMMASLRAVGLAPNPVPVRIDEDRKPYGDF
jgi:hypothetical protein